MSDHDDEDYFIPLTDQRVFGAGIKRKGIAFVPASEAERSVSAPPAPNTQSAGDRYLSIVLGKEVAPTSGSLPQSPAVNAAVAASHDTTCSLCKQPIAVGNNQATTDAHETSIAHQVCIEHSHPPSHLDRHHIGLKYLTGYGWDPDARKGLGAREEGIRNPIKAREKRDTAGLGVVTKDADSAESIKQKPAVKSEGRVVKLNSKEIKKLEAEKRKKAERLRDAFYGEDLSQYLGPDA